MIQITGTQLGVAVSELDILRRLRTFKIAARDENKVYTNHYAAVLQK